jgi:RimJ/RimL family protein N-acetyltransferase/N-acetylglutamate synthase-like GNAT family acetyltransferase
MKLRGLKPQDCETLLSWIPSADALFQWSGPWDFTWPLTLEQLVRDLDGASDRRLVLAAVDEPGGELVGHVMLTVWPPHGFGLIGRVLVDPGRRGAGLGTALMREVARFAFDELGLHRLQLAVYDFNAAAIACYEAVGFVIEGRLRDSARGTRGYWSAYVMGLLEDDYRAGPAPASSDGLGIRRARFADARVLAHLLDELGYPQAVDEVRTQLELWAGDPRATVLIAELDGAPAGVIAARAMPHFGHPGLFVRVLALAVDSRCRRAGVGRRLLAAVEEWAAGLGCTDIELTSRRTRDDAHAFYRELGFEDASGRSALFRRSLRVER